MTYIHVRVNDDVYVIEIASIVNLEKNPSFQMGFEPTTSYV